MQKTIIALAVLLSAWTGLAAVDDPCEVASSTSDVRFELAVKDGRTTFQEGEIIPLVLSFSSAVKDRYWDDIAAIAEVSVQRLGEHRGRQLDCEILDRYAGISALSVVQKIVDNPAPRCVSPQALRYLLRVEPAYGAKLVGSLLNSGKDNACNKHLLQNLADALPDVQDLAIQAVDDPNPDVASDALLALTRWGTADAEPLLWARLKRFHEEWADEKTSFWAPAERRSNNQSPMPSRTASVGCARLKR
jgi:hypothetical protein